MKVCIFGAGAIGGYLGVQLAQAGAEVSLVARGPHLEAMRKNGVRLLKGDEEIVAHPTCTNDPAELGVQDCVIVGLKGHQLSSAVESMQPLLGNDTSIVTAVNGIPYWYFYKHGGKHEGSTLESVDPGGGQWGGCVPNAPSAASFIRRRRSSSRVSSDTSMATSSRSASRRASARSASRGSPICLRKPALKRR